MANRTILPGAELAAADESLDDYGVVDGVGLGRYGADAARRDVGSRIRLATVEDLAAAGIRVDR